MVGELSQVACAMEGLAKISSGRMKSMVLIGKSKCSFLAAFAQWFLDLKVIIQDTAGE